MNLVYKSFMDQITMQPMRAARAGVRRMIKHKLKTDMTPMVDLGFLLITFFVFTAEISKPTAMNLNMPTDGPPMQTGDSRTITFLMSGNNKLFYYPGKEEDAIKNNLISLITYDEKLGIGKIIREKQLQLERSGIDKKELMVLLKPSKESVYKNTVDILDEMTINGVTRYVLVKPNSLDLKYLETNQ